MSARDYLAEVAARTQAATPGPWAVLWGETVVTDHERRAVDGHYPSGGYRYGHHIAALGGSERDDNEPGDAPVEDDATFVAAARTDVPRLAAALTAVLAECRAAACAGEREVDAVWLLSRIDTALEVAK